MSKCGGKDINSLFKYSGIKCNSIGEPTGLTAYRTKNTYVIASVRNPCSYALRLWAFQGEKPWAEKQNQSSCSTNIYLYIVFNLKPL